MCTWYKGITKSTLPQDGRKKQYRFRQNICLYYSRIDEGDEIFMVVKFDETSNFGNPYFIQKASQ